MVAQPTRPRRQVMPLVPEPLERRRLLAADAAVEPAADNNAPEVEAVYVNGTQWTTAFREYLEDERLGSGLYGFDAGGSGRGEEGGDILPWINLDQVSVQFSEDVVVQQDDLEIISLVERDYNVVDFDYDDETFTATWTLDGPIAADVIELRLDGTSATGVTDTAGNPLRGNESGGGGQRGRDHVQELSVLPGDVNRSGFVNAVDYTETLKRFFTSTTGGNAREEYSPFYDVDGNGVVNAVDFSEVKKRWFTGLPHDDD